MERISWELEIEKDREDRKKSILFAFNRTEEIEKSIDGLRYSDSELNKIVKKGSEIKNKLLDEKIEYGVKYSICKEKLLKAKSDINIEPSENLKYDYSQMRDGDSDNDYAPKMREYNNIFYEVERLKEDIRYINILLSNIKEDKSYNLTVRVANELGFES